MPIEIKELHIKATVNVSESENNTSSQNSSEVRDNNLLTELLDQFKKIMLEKNER